MIFDVIEIDLNLISSSIKEYINIYNKNPSYLIMNNETGNLLKSTCEKRFNFYQHKCNDSYYSEFEGIKIAFCQAVPTGKVDVI